MGKPFSQWQLSFQMRAVLPLAEGLWQHCSENFLTYVSCGYDGRKIKQSSYFNQFLSALRLQMAYWQVAPGYLLSQYFLNIFYFHQYWWGLVFCVTCPPHCSKLCQILNEQIWSCLLHGLCKIYSVCHKYLYSVCFHSSSLVMTFREHSAWVVNVCFQKTHETRIVSAR